MDEAIEELMRLGDDDPLRAPPVGPRPLLLDPRPDLLPIHELTPEDFERLLLRVVEEVEGLREVHLYGVPGQRQDGLDGIGFDPAGRPVGFQAKRYLVFAARDLIDAVDAYTSGRRRIRVVRLLIGVATEVRRTEILNELTAQRANHPDLEIELYDRRRLSDLMRDRPDIVRRFFGDAAAERFCLGLTGEAPSATGPPLDAVALADAVMRGPVEAAGMAEALAYADRQRDKHSEEAADAYLRVEQALEKRRFGSHAFLVRQRRAAALRAAGRLDESAGLLGDSVWLYLHRGDVDEARIALHQLDDLVGPQRPAAQKPSGTPSLVSGQTQLLHQALEASVTLVQDPIDRMSSLGEVVDELLTARHLYAGRVAVLFAETALAAANRATFGARMLALAVDPDEPGWNRREFLDAATNIVGDLVPSQRLLLFEQAITIAQGNFPPSKADEDRQQTDHPLSRFRIRLSGGDIRPIALQVAARVASTPQDAHAVQAVALELLRQSDAAATHHVAVALSFLPKEWLTIDPRILATHPDKSLRMLAAPRWAQEPTRDPALGLSLARDSAPGVRRTLAKAISEQANRSAVEAVLETLRKDPCHSIRRTA